MNVFSKPLLTEEAPEPPLLEQKAQEESHQRTRQSLVGMQGARRAVEDAGLMPKPPIPVKKPDAPTVKAKAAEIAAPKGRKAPPAAKPKPRARVKQAAKPKPKPVRPDTRRKAAQPEPERKPEPAPQLDKDKIARQEALSGALETIYGQPEPEAFAALFEQFANAPDRECAGAAVLLATAFLRTPAKRRTALLKALQPPLRAARSTKLAALLLQKIGTVLVAKPPAPVAPPPGG